MYYLTQAVIIPTTGPVRPRPFAHLFKFETRRDVMIYVFGNYDPKDEDSDIPIVRIAEWKEPWLVTETHNPESIGKIAVEHGLDESDVPQLTAWHTSDSRITYIIPGSNIVYIEYVYRPLTKQYGTANLLLK